MSAFLAFACYGVTWADQIRALGRRTKVLPWLIYLLIPALLFHAYAVYHSIYSANELQLGIFQMSSAFFLAMNIIVGLSLIKLPLRSLFTLLLPMSMLSLICGYFFAGEHTLAHNMSPPLATHILLSVIAYSLLAIAALQALLLNYQTTQLKQHHVKSVMGIFPPLQTMESLLFNLLWAGFIVLTLSIATGVIFIDDIIAQKLTHKAAFSVLSWILYAILLTGRHVLGWRGKTALHWVMTAFVMLVIAYFGTKFVLEILLANKID
jgi:ABC-type uncharacterized transport system permease subunit